MLGNPQVLPRAGKRVLSDKSLPRSVGLLCCDLTEKSPRNQQEKDLVGGRGWVMRFEGWIGPCVLRAEEPGRSPGRLAQTEGYAPPLWWKWAESSLQASPRCSSRSTSEFVQPLCHLGREDFVFDVPNKPNKCLRKILGKLIPFGWSLEEEI